MVSERELDQLDFIVLNMKSEEKAHFTQMLSKGNETMSLTHQFTVPVNLTHMILVAAAESGSSFS